MNSHRQKIIPSIWFDRQGEEATRFYTTVFNNSSIGKISRYSKEGFEQHGMPEGTALAIDFELEGFRFTAINGGPVFTPNPSISFFVVLKTDEAVEALWNALIVDGEELMPLGKYDWSEKYGWLNDRYGVSWQITRGDVEEVGQTITPLLFFTGERRGQAEAAHDFYLEIFSNSKSDGVLKYEPGEHGPTGMVKHCQFKLEGEAFMAMDSGVENNYPFSEGVSLMISCADQAEVDYYWNRLLRNGGTESQCGWLKDKFGISWQVIPEVLPDLLYHPDKEAAARATEAMLAMKKIDINLLQKAFGE